MANCLPGPSSTQVAFAIGITQGGVKGGLLAGFMFIIPGAIMLSALGFVSSSLSRQIEEPASPANAVVAGSASIRRVFLPNFKRFSSLISLAIPKLIAYLTSEAIACSAVGVALVFIAISGLIKKQVFEAGNNVILGAVCFFRGATCLLVHPAPAWLNPSLIFLGGLVTIVFPVPGHRGSGRLGFSGSAGF